MYSSALKSLTSGLSDIHWLFLYGLILASWTILFGLHFSGSHLEGMNAHGFDYYLEIGTVGPDKASPLVVLGMWAAMAAAMMLPGFIPALSTYEDLIKAGAGNRTGFLELIAGYLGSWIGFSLVAAILQYSLAMNYSSLVPNEGTFRIAWVVALLAISGAYQFFPAKSNCLVKCRHPFSVFMELWSDKRWNALFIGLRFGIYCIGCCWALMALSLVGGVMSLAWMGVGTVLMTLEKFPRFDRQITKPLGIALLSAAAILAAASAWII